MLLTRVRVSPCRARESRSSSGRVTTSSPSSLATEIGSTTVWVRAPLGPLTVTSGPSIVTSTPAGTGIGSLPIRDMSSPLPDVGEDFPAHLLLGGLPVGQQTGRGRDDRDTQPAEHLGQLGGPCVHAQPGLGHPPDPGDGPFAVRAVLEVDHQGLAHRRLAGGPGGDVALLDQDVGDIALQLREGHDDLFVIRRVGVADPRQEIRDRVGHGHVGRAFLAWFPRRPRRLGGQWAWTNWWCRWTCCFLVVLVTALVPLRRADQLRPRGSTRL